MTDFTIIRRSLTSRLFSTVTTVLTVAVAVALLLTLLAMRQAGQQAFQRGSGNMHLLVSGDASPMVAVLNGIFYASAPARPIPFARYRQMADDPRIEWAIPTQQGDTFRGQPVLATTPEFFTLFQPEEGRPWRFAAGRAFEKDFEVVLGAQAAAATGLQVGSALHLTHGSGQSRDAHVHDEFTYRVVGVLAPTGTAHDRALFTSLNSAWVIHAFDRLEREGKITHDHDHHDHHEHGDHDHDHDHAHEMPEVEVSDADRLITGVYIRTATRSGSGVSAVMPQVASELRRETGFTVAAPTDEMRRLFVIVSNVDVIFRAMAVVVLVSSAIAIMVALYNSMNERRRQIAVLRVLGSSRGRIFGLVLTESALLGVLGAVAGLVLSLIGGLVAAEILQQRVGLVIRPSYGLEWVLPVLVGTILLAAVAGIIPAAMAYRTGVAKNLRPVG